MLFQDNGVLRLFQNSLSWEYFGGSRFQVVRHPESSWRVFPYMVIVCPVEGVYHSRIEGVGRFEIHAGETLLVPREVPHTVAMPNEGVLHHAHILFTVINSTDVMRFYNVPPLVKGETAIEIGNVTRDLHEAMDEACPLGQIVSRAIRQQQLSTRLLDLIASVSESRHDASERFMSFCRVEPALKYMEEHLALPIYRRKLAQTVSLSETRFHYVFKAATGVAPMVYLKNVRMRRAQILLAQTDLGVADIGERVGYPDLFHFSKTFRHEFNMSPSRYRGEMRQWVRQTMPTNDTLFCGPCRTKTDPVTTDIGFCHD